MKKELGLEARVLVKLEYFNPAGSVKDRIAKGMIEDAEEKGLLKEFDEKFYALTKDCIGCWGEGPMPWEGACI